MISPNPQSAVLTDHLIIHHLSDLHFHDDEQNKGRLAFDKYIVYLRDLELEQRPHLIIITGDLTEGGDSRDLAILAGMLRSVPTARLGGTTGALASQICVVPGPRDIAWDTSSNRDHNLSFQGFYQSFKNFILPSQQHGIPQHLKEIGSPLFTMYPLDTCFIPESLPYDIQQEFHKFGDRYDRFRRDHRQYRPKPGFFSARNRQNDRDNLRLRFLDLTEGNSLTILDAGRIDDKDLREFTKWAKQVTATDQTGQTQLREPLKILVSHHPLLAYSEPKTNDADKEAVLLQRNLRDLVYAANDAGFHLALHGHIHKPHVLSDLSIFADKGDRRLLRQAGAGSLAESMTFTEITANYRTSESMWQLEIRTVNVDTATPSTSLMLLNPVEDISKRADALDKQLQLRVNFEQMLGSVMHLFAETIVQKSSRREDRDKDFQTPQNAMSLIRDLIHDTIFDNEYDLGVSFVERSLDLRQQIWILQNTFLTPSANDPKALLYPASVAGWALMLGQSLIYPDVTSLTLGEEDELWLKSSGKIPRLQDALNALSTYAKDDKREKDRFERLSRYLEQIVYPSGLQKRQPFQGSDLYQPPLFGQPRTYPVFISIPVPLRTRVLPELPEIGVLNVYMRERPTLKEKSLTPEELSKKAFTQERRELLETLSHLLAVILTSSNALGNPRGAWFGK
jgi:3',5'-cyclic AMP phosphodiesterase CpdA